MMTIRYASRLKLCAKVIYIEHKLKRPDIYIFHSGEDILASDIKPDIVYLDIQMSGIDGIAVGNSLVKSYPAAIIIIITSFPEYLDEAMRFHVFRYISKPVESKRFMRNLEDAISEFNSIGGRIIVKCKGTTYILSAKDIIMVGVNLTAAILLFTRFQIHIQPLRLLPALNQCFRLGAFIRAIDVI